MNKKEFKFRQKYKKQKIELQDQNLVKMFMLAVIELEEIKIETLSNN